MILSNSKKIIEKVKMLREHGITKNPKILKNKNPWHYEQRYLGFNYRMSEVHSALALSQMKSIKKNLSERKKIAKKYFKELNTFSVKLPNHFIDKNINCSFHLFPILILVKNISFKKIEIFKELLKKDMYFSAVRAKFGYAITCHKSQGGEWKNVIIDFQRSQGFRNEDFYRWAYTSITRSTEKLWHVNAPELTSFDKVRIDSISIYNRLVRKRVKASISESLNNFHDEKSAQFL